MHVLVILTYGVSFKDWAQSGLLDREILLYEKLLKEKKIRFTFVSFGDSEDTELINDFNVILIFFSLPCITLTFIPAEVAISTSSVAVNELAM